MSSLTRRGHGEGLLGCPAVSQRRQVHRHCHQRRRSFACCISFNSRLSRVTNRGRLHAGSFERGQRVSSRQSFGESPDATRPFTSSWSSSMLAPGCWSRSRASSICFRAQATASEARSWGQIGQHVHRLDRLIAAHQQQHVLGLVAVHADGGQHAVDNTLQDVVQGCGWECRSKI